MPGLFVTATGTDVGKTYVSCGLIRALRRAGHAVAALKPVASGFDPADPAASDAAALLIAMGLPLTPAGIASVSPQRFRAPLSPDMAARLEGSVLRFEAIVDGCLAALQPPRWTVIEGVGGVMVPLGGGRTVLDLMAHLDLPTVLVSPTDLGALSHLLTARAAMAGRGLRSVAVILSESENARVPLELTLETLREHGLGEELFVLRRARPGDQDAAFDDMLAHVTGRMTGHRAD